MSKEKPITLATILAAIKQQTSNIAALNAKFDAKFDILTDRITALEARSILRSKSRSTQLPILQPTLPPISPPLTTNTKEEDTEQEKALQHAHSYKNYRSPTVSDWEENDVLQEIEKEVELPQLLPQITRVQRSDRLRNSKNEVRVIDKSWTTLFCTAIGPPAAVSYWLWMNTPGLSSGAPSVAPVSLGWHVSLIGQSDVWMDGYDYG